MRPRRFRVNWKHINLCQDTLWKWMKSRAEDNYSPTNEEQGVDIQMIVDLLGLTPQEVTNG
ncbi:hypothetical protein GCM10007423_28530 [Dyadobacter endophyticus]|uniref:Uncharacterized protein n=1 Tax=Dyadobacter endophyticus TaxID=1749036 RepID=A0ABQ1YRR5_9BACT|nr:hypothetical protein GCM10007423_28530 [Dyadobacter endophyticus]